MMTDSDRYLVALHAMQSGVAAMMGRKEGSKETDPKHLRVGINSAMCEHAALVSILIEKGIFTEAEYMEKLADEMEAEKARYEERLSTGGSKIVLA